MTFPTICWLYGNIVKFSHKPPGMQASIFGTCPTHTHNRFTALWILSSTTRVSRYQKKHSPTHTHRGHQSCLYAFSIYYDPWHPPYSIHMLYSLFHNLSQSFLWSTSGPGTLHFILHTLLHPIIVVFSQHMPIPSKPVSL